MLESLRFLVVEDNRNMATALRMILLGVGARFVDIVHDGGSAVERCAHRPPDVIITDYDLGDMTGVELTRQLRTAPDGPCANIPIMLVSGYSDIEIVLAATEAGIDEFVTKPINARAMATCLDAMLFRRGVSPLSEDSAAAVAAREKRTTTTRPRPPRRRAS